jgi:hypothetical protein
MIGELSVQASLFPKTVNARRDRNEGIRTERARNIILPVLGNNSGEPRVIYLVRTEEGGK